MNEIEMMLFFLPFLVGIGVGGPAPAPAPAPKPTEDSAAAAVLIAAASLGSFSDVPGEMRSWAAIRMERACGQFPRGSLSSMVGGIIETLRSRSVLGVRSKPDRIALNAFVSEFFSCAILKRLGIATAPVKIVTAREARNQRNVVVKWFQPGNPNGLKYDADLEKRLRRGELADNIGSHLCLVSTLVPGAASLSYLRSRFDLVKEPPVWKEKKFTDALTDRMNGLFIGPEMKNWAEVNEQYETLVHEAIGKVCTDGFQFYIGYSPNDREKIRSACAWNGPQFLKISAARVFLGCSAGHYSNLLCTQDGRLVSIDHCMALTDEGESIRMLFEHTEKDTLAFECLSHVGKLTDDDIKAAIAQVPRHPACGSPPDALERNLSAVRDYYITRLGLWKRLLSEAEENVPGSVVSLRSERERHQQTV